MNAVDSCTIAQSWIAPLSVLGHSWPAFLSSSTISVFPFHFAMSSNFLFRPVSKTPRGAVNNFRVTLVYRLLNRLSRTVWKLKSPPGQNTKRDREEEPDGHYRFLPSRQTQKKKHWWTSAKQKETPVRYVSTIKKTETSTTRPAAILCLIIFPLSPRSIGIDRLHQSPRTGRLPSRKKKKKSEHSNLPSR